jgi:hypothetical protein
MHSHKAARPAPALAESEPRNSDPLPRAINSVDTPPRIEPQPFPVTLAGRMSPIGYVPENDAPVDGNETGEGRSIAFLRSPARPDGFRGPGSLMRPHARKYRRGTTPS